MPTTRETTAARVPSILVVDDEPGLRDFMKYELTGRGYEVSAAANGGEALRAVGGREFDLVISDVRMPGLDGIDLLKRLRRDVPGTEVVLTTGYGTVDMAVRAMKEGAFDFLLKPVDTERLSAVVAHALESGELKSLVAINETSLALFRSVEYAEVLPVIVRAARRLLGARRALIAVRAASGECRVVADTEDDGASAEDLRSAMGGRSGDLAPFSGTDRTSRPVVVEPMSADGKIQGWLVAFREPGAFPFGARDVRHARLFAVQASQALKNAELFRKLETSRDRLLQSEKINAIGRIAAGIAHEINNPLAVILNAAQMARDDIASTLSATARLDLDEVVRQAVRCGKIVGGLMDLVNHREPKMEELDVSGLVLSSVDEAREWIRGVAVRTDVAPAVRARGDALHLRQVVDNLLRNAVQAMAGTARREAVVRVRGGDAAAIVEVEDSGPGLPAGKEDRLFESFFTTKPAGKGTGLGLYLCRLMIERSGGRITARNRDGGGARFTVELPLGREAAVPGRRQ